MFPQKIFQTNFFGQNNLTKKIATKNNYEKKFIGPKNNFCQNICRPKRFSTRKKMFRPKST